MLAKVYSAAIIGLEPVLIEVEVDIAAMGLPSFTIVGLPEKSVEEAKERVRSAIKNSGADFPTKRITVNLAPALIPKEGTHYDLPIAIGILIASGQLELDTTSSLFVGELSLNGDIRPVPGVLPMVSLIQKQAFQTIFVPKENGKEASIMRMFFDKAVDTIAILPAASLVSIVSHVTNIKPIEIESINAIALKQAELHEVDFKDIKGQEHAKRAMEIAAAGGHNILLKGVPGAGKTMLARAFSSILPELTPQEALETTKIYSVCGLLPADMPLITKRPFRNPHHTISQVGLIGGSSKPRPGEISLAHRGVLFLDEFPQFSKMCIESLRAPIEDGKTAIVRAHQSVIFPSKFILVAALNPCPCGYLGDNDRQCSCTYSQVTTYQKRISGPIIDRIDLHITVPKVDTEKLLAQTNTSESSHTIKLRVQKARNKQLKRYNGLPITCNAEMRTTDLKKYCLIDNETTALMKIAIIKFHLTARSYTRILKIARTIADLEAKDIIEKNHVAEALQYRPFINQP